MSNSLDNAYPGLAATLRKLAFASLPTPLSQHVVKTRIGDRRIAVKHDEQSSLLYGGNKIRKLEYLLQRATDRGAECVATFGAAGSNHALATAIHSRQLGMDCTCFLTHQPKSETVRRTLSAHLELGTELIKWGSSANRIELYRRTLQRRKTWVIPLGGSCWLGAVGFVNAGMELAEQISAGEIDAPTRVYIANGTMGSVAGLSLGFALAGMSAEIHAVRVADNQLTRHSVLRRLVTKTAILLNRMDSSIPVDLASKTKIVWRDDFYAGGYAVADERTAAAVKFAARELGIPLETTYTGKALAALRHDLQRSDEKERFLFWNTHNSRAIPLHGEAHSNLHRLPTQFLRYFE